MLYQTSKFALASQSAKGTAATSNFVSGRMQQHAMTPRFEVTDTAGEHIGSHSRSTALQSTPIRTGHLVDISFRQRLYPTMFGVALKGIGFTNTTSTTVILTIDATGGTFTMTITGTGTVTTSALAFDIAAAAMETALELLTSVTAATVTGSAGGPFTITLDSSQTAAGMTASAVSLTGGASTAVYSGWYYTHVFTLPTASSEGWITAYEYLGEVDGFDKIAKDARLSQMVFAADNTGIILSGTGVGITDSDAAGSEALTTESDYQISQANGSFTMTSTDLTANTIGVPRGHTFTIDNPLDETEQQLHSFGRATFSPTGKAFNGVMTGFQFSENAYSELVWGSASGTAPLITIPEAQLTWSFQSPRFITGAIPYVATFDVAVAHINIQPYDISAGGQILYDLNYEVVDQAASAPVTITLQNDYATYAGS